MQPLEFFALDVGFADDPRIRKLVAEQGGLALSVWILLLGHVYSSPSGYWVGASPPLVDDVASTLRCKPAFVREVIRSCFRIGLFRNVPGIDEYTILTSPAIQRRFLDLSRISHQQAVITDYCLISDCTTSDRFPPTLDDVRHEIDVRNWNGIIDADEFYRYYDSVNWRIQGEPISDWREKVAKWALRRLYPQPKRKQHAADPNCQPAADDKRVYVPPNTNPQQAKIEAERRQSFANAVPMPNAAREALAKLGIKI